MAAQSLAVRALSLHEGVFNWVFFIWYFVSAILTVVFLFYFNRLFASIATYGIRAYLWHYYRVHVKIHALQVSLLAGRVFFKNIRYHGQNETILIHDGYVTWRYWLRHVAKLDCQRSQLPRQNQSETGNLSDKDAARDTTKGVEAGRERGPRQLPCRVLLKARGVEWFIYNRSPAYDAVFRNMRDGDILEHSKNKPNSNENAKSTHNCGDEVLEKEQWPSRDEQKDGDGEFDEMANVEKLTSISTGSLVSDHESASASLPGFLNLFPIGVECSKGAIVMGNRNTHSILTAKFESAAGMVNAKESHPVDRYKQTFDFDFIHPVIEFKHNKDYTEPQLDEGANLHAENSQDPRSKSQWLQHLDYRNHVRHALKSLRDFIPYRRGSVESFNHPHSKLGGAYNLTDDDAGAYGQHRWLGLTRYLNDDDDDLVEQERWKAVEYGQFPTIVDSPKISTSFYWDVPGLVPDSTDSSRKPSPGFEANINGDVPPDWGIDLKVCGGTIHYGPWADRQRSDLQAVFFPTLYKDAVSAAKLAPGQNRMSTALKILVELEAQTTIRVPSREESKDWRWRRHNVPLAAKSADNKKPKFHGKGGKRKKPGQSSDKRPAGWLDVRVLPDSTVNFAMDMVARNNGYQNHIDLDLKGLEISSSVNHALLWRSKSQTISCDLSNPLAWNALRQWRVDIRDSAMELFILRDHMFLLTDLISDWTSGPPGDFHTFVPFEYSIALHFSDFQVYLNANDSNIINSPSDLEDNTFVILRGNRLRADLVIPTKTFRPTRNEVAFEVKASDCGLHLHAPPRNTQHTFLDRSNLGSLKDLRVKGSFNYFSTTSPTLTDILLMDVYGVSPRIHSYGFLIRYLIKIKDNYFGDDIHFRTLEEYQVQMSRKLGQGPEDTVTAQHNRTSNDLDVILGISAENLYVLLPAQLYSSDENVRLDILSVTSDLRITNYYMDLALASTPIAISHTSHSEKGQHDSETYSSTQLFVDGLQVFGHRLFGLPPTEPTYVCNWDFDVGSITGECSIDFLRCLVSALRCFGFTFDDAENALPPLNPDVIHDVTFLRARSQSISIGLRVEQSILLLRTGGINFDFNDWAGALFSGRLHLLIPDLTLAIADAHPMPIGRRVSECTPTTHAFLQTTVELNSVSRKEGFKADRNLQQSHVALHDTRTSRVPWLIHDQDQQGTISTASHPNKIRPPVMPYPSMPRPIFAENPSALDEVSSTFASTQSKSSRSPSTIRSSFLMNATSVQGRSKRPPAFRRTTNRRGQEEKASEAAGTKISTNKTSNNQPAGVPANNPVFENVIPSTAEFAPSSISFSSPYKRPHFPFLATKLDTGDLPGLPEHIANDGLPDDPSILESFKKQPSSENSEQFSFMLNMSPGVQLFCTPTALFLMTEVVKTFQADDAVTLLDHLQIDSMTDVLSTGKTREEENKVNDVRILVPWVAVRFVNTAKTEPTNATRQDRYDLTLDQLNATAAISSQLSNDAARMRIPHYSVHLVLNQWTCSALEVLEDKANDQAIISLSICQPVFWMFYGETATAEVQSEKLEIMSASRKVDYISSLLRQTLNLCEDLAGRITKFEKERKSRIRLLVLLLSAEGDDIPDPPFLTRVSYVLRTASRHIRTSDSWKLISRLRYIYQCLPERSQGKINAQCIHQLAACPHDAGQRVMSRFSHWQTSDLKQVNSCLLMHMVYSELRKPSVPKPATVLPLKARMRLGVIRIVVEPGPKQNEISIGGLVIGLAIYQPSLPKPPPSYDVVDTVGSTIQIHCVEIAIRLNWSLLGLLESVIGTVRTATKVGSQGSGAPSDQQIPLARHGLHLIASSEMSFLNCDTPNLKAVSLCQGLKTTLVMSKGHSHLQGPSLSILLNADAATSEIKSHSTLLTSYKLRQPRIFGIKQGNTENDQEKSWKFVGTGQNVLFRILANPLQLIEAADCFLEQEIAHVVNWTKSLRPGQAQAHSSVKGSKQLEFLRIQFALSLESYLVSVGILPSLTYQISGTRARTFVKMGERGNHDLALDFHLHEHSHAFIANRHGSEASTVLSTLHMPPTNGQLSLDLAPAQKSVDFSGLIENVVFDASAVHAIFTAINRPEIVTLGTSIDSELSVFQSHYKGIFDRSETRHKSNSSEPVLYSGNITLESLALHARTSESLSVARGAELQFKMSQMHMKATNRESGSRTALKFPELDLQLRGIDLSLLRFDELHFRPCGNLTLQAMLRSTSKSNDVGRLVRSHQVRSNSLQVNIYSDTAPVIVAILVHLQETMKDVDFSQEVKNLKKLGRARLRSEASSLQTNKYQAQADTGPAALFNAMYSLEMTNICVTWRIDNSTPRLRGRELENLILSFTKIYLANEKENAARLLIENLQLQMVPASETTTARSLNSALLPEVLFNVAYVSTPQDRRLAFQVAGKSLDLRLTSQFILPTNDLRRSIALSIQQVRTATADWTASTSKADGQTKRLIGNKRLASLLIDADFAGAVVYTQGRSVADPQSTASNVLRGGRLPQHGRYNQFAPENGSTSSTTLRAPGIAFKVEYKNASSGEQSINAEMKVDASSNILYPTVVPLVIEISSTVRDIVAEPNEQRSSTKSGLPQPRFLEDERLRGGDPAAIFGNCRLNLGLRICKQEFSLSCQPIARVAATAQFDDIYITVNTIQSHEHAKFFTISGAITRLQASVQHVYSRESTGSFEVDSVVVSLMNSKHVSAANGISAILNISPMKAQINGKQSQDFLLFREIWVPPEIRRSTPAAVPVPASESQAFIVQRYQQMAATSAFPWNATISIAELDVQVDLGQSLGKSAFTISEFWISSKKTSDWEQNLSLGFDKMAVNSTGRMSGFVELQHLKVRTSIQWPATGQVHNETPLIQASLAFEHLRVKAAFDYQAFAIADITAFEFLMYNVRNLQNTSRDRLVGVLDGDKMQVFCTTTSASQVIALYQAFQRLYQEKLAAYQTSLRDIEKFLRRKSSINPSVMPAAAKQQREANAGGIKSALKLQTDVVVTLKAINIGAFPSTFFDNQVFKLEALDASARFAVLLDKERTHSNLGMTLGQLCIALAGITRANGPKTLGEVSVADVVASATGSRGGTILKVPKLVASMETWQSPDSTNIDYIFKSSFQGRVDVGWNYSRISYIRGMWTSHARALAQRLGKPLPQSAVQITGGPRPAGDEGNQTYEQGEQGKITAVVNVPQSKYQYTALQPPLIETPQLRDMGEATPPLEWIGLHRERLPNLTHQIVIVTLLEVAKEVDDAYSKILGSS